MAKPLRAYGKIPFYDAQGNVTGVLAIAVDITEQKALQKDLVDAKEAAEQDSRHKTQFIQNMHHDIRTPMSSAWSFANFLAEKEDDPDKKETLTLLAECNKELLDYCDHIVDFSRVTHGLQPIRSELFDLSQLIESVRYMECAAALHKGLEFTVQIANNVPKQVIGDRERLHAILLNLLGNAVKFTDEGQVALRVQLLKRERRAIVLRFTISDTGMGMAPGEQTRIFNPFTRLTPANKGLHKGAGLGLAMVKQFVDELGGDIDVVSDIDRGTQMICTLPFTLLT